MAATSTVNPEAFGKAGIEAYLTAAVEALKDDEPDVEEALAQIAAARVLISMFKNEIKDRDAAEVANELHDGVAIINGRLFEVEGFLPEEQRVRTSATTAVNAIVRATIKIKWR